MHHSETDISFDEVILFSQNHKFTYMQSLDSLTVIQQAIIEANLRLSYASVCEVQAKAVSYTVAGKDVFISVSLYQENLPVSESLLPVFDRLFGYKSGNKTSIALDSNV